MGEAGEVSGQVREEDEEQHEGCARGLPVAWRFPAASSGPAWLLTLGCSSCPAATAGCASEAGFQAAPCAVQALSVALHSALPLSLNTLSM